MGENSGSLAERWLRTRQLVPYPHSREAAREGNVDSETVTKNARNTQKIHIEQHTFMGIGWCAAWLFTIGFLHLNFWRGVLAIILWPYYIGVHISALVH